MTLIDGGASLVVSSEVGPMSEVSVLLGLSPSYTREPEGPRGEKSLRARPGVWMVKVSADEAFDVAAADDSSGFASLTMLLALLDGKAGLLARLSPNFSYYVDWYGSHDGAQGGFVMPRELMSRLGELGCDLFGNIYSNAPE